MRASGFATTDEEYSLGIIGIARLALVGGEPVGFLSVAVPKVRFDAEVEARVRDLLARTAALLRSDRACGA